MIVDYRLCSFVSRVDIRRFGIFCLISLKSIMCEDYKLGDYVKSCAIL